MSVSSVPPAPFDPLAFRAALGAFVTGVTIVTTRDRDGAPVGLTANSFNSVSLDPPMILWSLDLGSTSLGAFREAEWWAVHVLASSQEALSGRFARRGGDKFAGLAVQEGPGGIPLIDGCAARFICRTAFEYDGGDHAIFVGEVVDFERAAHTPLAYHQGRYARVLAPAEPARAAEPASDGPGAEEPFGRHFLGHDLGRAYHELFGDIRREYRKRGLNGAEYQVLSLLGTGEDCTVEDLVARAARDGVEAPEPAIGALEARGYLRRDANRARLSAEGHHLVIELIAVAQASQARLEARLAPGELAMLRHLIDRVIETSTN
jgi:flavin reductase (DIM6/NTAB) family NADH-FMN oxidoreductase RutF/DNA-binding MarR family transcriptional regulator